MVKLTAFVQELRNSTGHRRYGWIFRLLVTILVTAWILRSVNIEEFRRVAVAPDWWPLAGMILIAWLFQLIGATKYWLLFRALTWVPFRAFVKYFLVATSLASFTPASLGEFSLAAFLRREGIPVHQTMSVMVVDRVITVWMYATVFLPLTLGLLLHTDRLWWAPVAFPVGGGLLLVLNSIPVVRQVVYRVLMGLRLSFLTDFLATTSELLRLHPWHLMSNIGLTFARCLVSAVGVQFALWAAGEHGPFEPVLYITNSLAILNLLPVSVGGLGVYEGGGLVLFTELGFDRERVFAALVYQRIYVIVSSLLMLALSRLLLKRLAPPPGSTLEGNAP